LAHWRVPLLRHHRTDATVLQLAVSHICSTAKAQRERQAARL